MKPDIITIGEALIDFIPVTPGNGLAQTVAFEKRPGGAPANVAVGVSRLGGKAGFVSKLGRDEFGKFLAEVLRENAVDLKGITYTDEAKTGLAFVTLRQNGEREFIFYRDPCADRLLSTDDICREYVGQCKILHCGTVSLIAEPSRSATYFSLQTAHQAGSVISIDVNLRAALWPSLEHARAEIRHALTQADVVKLSEEELAFIVADDRTSALVEGAKHIRSLGPKLVLVTLGGRGCYYQSEDWEGLVPGFRVKAVDTTGAGDAFTAALLGELIRYRISQPKDLLAKLGPRQINLICKFANAAGALACTKKGAIPALPRRRDIEVLLSQF